MLSDFSEMFYVRLLLLSILLYNTEAWDDVDYSEYADSDPRGSSNSTIPNPVTNSTSTNATDTMPVKFINSNVMASTEPTYILGKTETNGTATKNEALDSNITTAVAENAPYYPHWYNEPTYAATTKTESLAPKQPKYILDKTETSGPATKNEALDGNKTIPYYPDWYDEPTYAATTKTESLALKEPKYILDKTETSGTATKNEALDGNKTIPYYPDWYDEPTYAAKTTTESSYDGYNRITTSDEKQPAPANTKETNNDGVGYGYLTVENGVLTAHFPEADTTTKDSEPRSTTTRKPYNFYWSNNRNYSSKTTTRRPYYSYWYNEHNRSDITTTESSYSIYNRKPSVDDKLPAAFDITTKKTYNDSDSYGYLTVENGFLTAHFPEGNNATEYSSYDGYNTTVDVKQPETAGNTNKIYYDSDGITTKNVTTAPGNSEFWGNKREHSETTTIRRPYYTRKSPWVINDFSHSIRRYYYPTSNAHIYVYNATNFTKNSSTRRSNWWDSTTSTRRPFRWWDPTTSTRRPFRWWDPTTSTRRPFRWWDPTTSTTTTESTNRPYWPGTNNNSTFSIHRPTTDYPYYIRSTSSPTFDQSILPNITNATSIYGAVAEFLKKLARTISPSGVKIVPNSNITNVAVANGNGNTIFYAYNYF